MTKHKRRAAASSAGTNGHSPQSLTPREGQVFALIVQGQSNLQIAHGLGVSLYTIKDYARVIYCKLGVENRVGAVLWAVQNTPHLVAPAAPSSLNYLQQAPLQTQQSGD